MHRGIGVAALTSILSFLQIAGCRVDQPKSGDVVQSSPETHAERSDSTIAPRNNVIEQTVYVPVYSHIYDQDGSREFDLTATLSVRNTDLDNPITLSAVRYYDSSGRLVRSYAEEPFVLSPLASRSYVVEERDRSGGVGANFIVEWWAGALVSAPVVEAVMISTRSAQGLSFVTRGQVVRPLRPDVDQEDQK